MDGEESNMEKKLRSVTKVVGVFDVLFLAVITILALVQGTNIDVHFWYRVLMCLSFSLIILFLEDGRKEAKKTDDTPKELVWFFIFGGLAASVFQNYLLYVEMPRGGEGHGCVLAAIAANAFFTSASNKKKG